MKNLNELLKQETFTNEEIVYLLGLTEKDEVEQLRQASFDLSTTLLGDEVYYRGIVEFSNICVLDCNYCGIRKSNKEVERYTLDKEKVVDSALWCGKVGYGSAVLQSGERRDPAFVDFVSECLSEIKEQSKSETLPDGLGITLSVGEHDLESYKKFYEAGAHRYLLRIETTNDELYAKLHPEEQKLSERKACLGYLREAGFQVGTGVMIGIPGQTLEMLAEDIRFFQEQDVDMIGMGPYITSEGGAMVDEGMMEEKALFQLALNMIAVTRLVLRDVNIAATTALQAIMPTGREVGISYGANVTMPNLTPTDVRPNYQLYKGKPCLDEGRDDCRGCLQRRVESVGRQVGWDKWGDSVHVAKRVKNV